MEKAIIRYLVAEGVDAKNLETDSRQAYKVVPYLQEINPLWEEVNKKNFSRKAHLHHQALYTVLLKFQRRPPSKELMERELIELEALRAPKEVVTLG